MLKARSLSLTLLSVISLSFFTTSVLAGGWPIYTWSWDNPDAWRSDYKLTYVRAHIAPDVPCKGTIVTFKYENPQPGDNVSAGGENGSFTFTEETYKISKYNGQKILDCNTYAKFYSTNNALKTGIVEFKTASGKVYKGTFALNFNQSNPGNTDSNEKYPLPWEEDYIKDNTSTPSPISTPAVVPTLPVPQMVYPQDGQALDLEEAYKFKVKPVSGASGYLFGLFQNGVMIYENYRDTKQLSTNGEFALGASDPVHVNFHTGEMKVMIRALVSGQWTDARTITITLKPRGGNVTSTITPQLPKPSQISTSEAQYISAAATNSSALQKRIDELQKKLEVSQQRQSDLEKQLSQIISWIRSVFPFFK